MAVRAMNNCAILKAAASPPVAAFRSCLRQLRTTDHRKYSKLGVKISVLRSESYLFSIYGSVRSYSIQSFVDTVMEELQYLRKRGRVGASRKLELTSSAELLEDKVEKRALQKGCLLEFKKDSERILLAVAQKPDGKKNWMVSDQNGVTTSIKPQQITFIVPGIENFDHTDIADFIQKAHNNLDPTLLEFAWIELLEKNKSVTIEELAEFGASRELLCPSVAIKR